jgi:hypothetical protein
MHITMKPVGRGFIDPVGVPTLTRGLALCCRRTIPLMNREEGRSLMRDEQLTRVLLLIVSPPTNHQTPVHIVDSEGSDHRNHSSLASHNGPHETKRRELDNQDSIKEAKLHHLAFCIRHSLIKFSERNNMPGPILLPPTFQNSFWSQDDFRSGMEVLFGKLEQVSDLTTDCQDSGVRYEANSRPIFKRGVWRTRRLLLSSR